MLKVRPVTLYRCLESNKIRRGHSYPEYELERCMAVVNSVRKFSFIVNDMGLITRSHMISKLAATVDDHGGRLFVIVFPGLFASVGNDDDVESINFGIVRHT